MPHGDYSVDKIVFLRQLVILGQKLFFRLINMPYF